MGSGSWCQRFFGNFCPLCHRVFCSWFPAKFESTRHPASGCIQLPSVPAFKRAVYRPEVARWLGARRSRQMTGSRSHGEPLQHTRVEVWGLPYRASRLLRPQKQWAHATRPARRPQGPARQHCPLAPRAKAGARCGARLAARPQRGAGTPYHCFLGRRIDWRGRGSPPALVFYTTADPRQTAPRRIAGAPA